MAVGMKMIVLWVVVPYSIIEIDRHFRVAYFLHHQDSGKGGRKLP
jgi:hypothetical protein